MVPVVVAFTVAVALTVTVTAVKIAPVDVTAV